MYEMFSVIISRCSAIDWVVVLLSVVFPAVLVWLQAIASNAIALTDKSDFFISLKCLLL